MSEDGVAVFTQTAPPPSLPLGDVGPNGELLGRAAISGADSMTSGLLAALATGLSRSSPTPWPTGSALDSGEGAGTAGRADRRRFVRSTQASAAGSEDLAQLPGAWLPELAILPRSRRGIDDPGDEVGNRVGGLRAPALRARSPTPASPPTCWHPT